jgi:hypothetical protein
MRRKTVAILILLTLVIISSSGCMGINVPVMPKIAPIQAPVVKPPNAFVEVKDINYNTTPSNTTKVNVTPTIVPTPTPTSRFVYV